VARRLLPVALVVAATWADSRGLHELAFYLLIAAVPAAAVSALSLFGELVELPGGAHGEARTRLETTLASLGLLLLLVAAALRGQGTETEVPPLAVSTLVACLLVFGAQSLTALVPVAESVWSPRARRPSGLQLERQRFRRVSSDVD
jgi:hypothetical protein